MRAVVQRVRRAEVRVGGELVAACGPGLLVLVGVAQEDTHDDARYISEKVANLRVFEDDAGKMNRSVLDVEGSVMVVSQFTLLGDARKGRRPSFSEAAEPVKAQQLYEEVCRRLEEHGLTTARGLFGAEMEIGLVNHGPVTLLLDSRRQF